MIVILAISLILVVVAGLLISAETAISRISRSRVDDLGDTKASLRLLSVLDDRPRFVNVLLFVSTVVVAALVGCSITSLDPDSSHGFGLALLLGLVIVVASMSLPWVGGLLRLLIGLTGMGLLISTVHDMWQSRPTHYA